MQYCFALIDNKMFIQYLLFQFIICLFYVVEWGKLKIAIVGTSGERLLQAIA